MIMSQDICSDNINNINIFLSSLDKMQVITMPELRLGLLCHIELL